MPRWAMDAQIGSSMELSSSDLARFWAGVDQRGHDECWPWKKALRAGYGTIKIGKRLESCHRIAFFITNGVWPQKPMVVGHKCDNRICCNPSHLELITFSKNNSDAFARGMKQAKRGTDAVNAQLTAEQVIEARRIAAERGIGFKRIATMLGIQNKWALREAIHGRTWKHVSVT